MLIFSILYYLHFFVIRRFQAAAEAGVEWSFQAYQRVKLRLDAAVGAREEELIKDLVAAANSGDASKMHEIGMSAAFV